MTKNEFRAAYREARLVFGLQDATGVDLDSIRLAIPCAVRSACYRHGDMLFTGTKWRHQWVHQFPMSSLVKINGPCGVLPV